MKSVADALQAISELSREFGTPDYVKGGGGNTSVKHDDILWIKPSGTTLAGLRPEDFVAMDRVKLAELYAMEVPEDAAARESRVKDAMLAAVCGGSRARPSVETPLHDVLRFTYVVHTHPPLVNGLTCAREGRAAASMLFPESLWIPYTDPGFTLSMVVRGRVAAYEREHGRQPAIILLENHGIFVGGDQPEDVRETYRHVRDTLRVAYGRAAVPMNLHYRSPTHVHELGDLSGLLAGLLGPAAAAVVACAPFELAQGALTPDHMVYAKAFSYHGPLSAAHLEQFRLRHGYAPRIVETPVGIFGLGRTTAAAELALDLAQDGGLVRQLTRAFGDVQYLSESGRRFIESWEVESYREQQLAGGRPEETAR